MTELITLPRTTVQQALEALEFIADEWGFTHKANRPERWRAIDALKAALEQPEQEEYTLVAWFNGKPVYSAPPRCSNCASLHALNGELLDALKYHQEQTRPIERTRAAIARAEVKV